MSRAIPFHLDVFSDLEATNDVRRALSLPIKVSPELQVTHPLLLEYTNPNDEYQLRPYQAQALQMIYNHHQEMLREKEPTGIGAFINLGTGHGKFLVSMGIAKMVGAVRPLLIVPAPMLNTTIRESYKFEFLFPDLFHEDRLVMSVGELSQAYTDEEKEQKAKKGRKTVAGIEKVKEFAPDIIIVDEAQMFKDPNAARTLRLKRYLQENPGCALYILSATLISKRVNDYAHLLALTMRGMSPLPFTRQAIDAMQRKYDDSDDKNDTFGMFIRKEFKDWSYIMLNEDSSFRAAIRKRVFTSQLIYSSQGMSCPMDIEFGEIRAPVPYVIEKAIGDLVFDWKLPDGTEMTEAAQWAAMLRYMSVGFWRREIVEDTELAVNYRAARKEWAALVRYFKQYEKHRQLDSPKMVEEAAKKELLNSSQQEVYENWAKIRHTYEIKYETVWLDKTVVMTIVQQIKSEHENCLFWFHNEDVGDILTSCGIPVYRGGGTNPSPDERFVGLSITAYSAGKNLQAWNVNCVLQPTSNPLIMEQLISRTHRAGQQNDVTVLFNTSTSILRNVIKKLQTETNKLSDLYVTALKAFEMAPDENTIDIEEVAKLLAEFTF